MIAKGGASLLQQEAIDAMIKYLLPLADVVTPNIPEAEALSGVSITDSESRQQAARWIHAYGCQYVMIKGGHEADTVYATDLLYDGSRSQSFLPAVYIHRIHMVRAARLLQLSLQGLRRVCQLLKLYAWPKFHQAAIAEPLNIGSGHGPTNHWAYQRGQRQESTTTVSNTIIVSHDVYAGGTR